MFVVLGRLGDAAAATTGKNKIRKVKKRKGTRGKSRRMLVQDRFPSLVSFF